MTLIIVLALTLNLLMFGFYAIGGIYSYIQHYDAYRHVDFFKHLFWVLIMPLVALFSLLGLFKVRWAGILSSIAGMAFHLFMTHGFIEWHFDPMEQGRNGGVLYLSLITFILAGLNFSALIALFKRRQETD